MSRETRTKRKYELKKRAEEVAETHLRITEAAIELHGTVGPSRTTLSAVAKRAGVERRTLYRHFPTEADLFAACSTHYFTANPWPDLGPWRAIRDPRRRLEQALDELYAYYERTEPMFSNVLRDAELVDLARDAVAPLDAYLEEAVEILTVGRRARGRRRYLLVGALRHALAFSTWHSLTASGITRAHAGMLVTALVEAAATPRGRTARPAAGNGSLVLRRLGHRPRRGHVLEAEVARGNHPGHHLDREPACPHRRVLVAEPARRLGVAHHDRDAAQAVIVLVDERPSADEVAAVAQIGSEGEMPILELGRLLVRELRCIWPTHEQHKRVPIEPHAAN